MASSTYATHRMTFAARARVQRTEIFARRIWQSDCGRYRVSEFKRLLEQGQKVYKAERLCGITSTWDVISTHRTRHAAERACRKHEGGLNGNP